MDFTSSIALLHLITYKETIMASKKLTLSADGTTATVAEATAADIFTTLISGDSCVTGAYGYIQKVGLFVGGMALQNYRLGQGLNPFAA
jgi:hypothetical protein